MGKAYLYWRKKLQGSLRGNLDGMIAPFILGVMIRSIYDYSLSQVWHEIHHRLILPEHYAAFVPESDPRREYVHWSYFGSLQDPIETQGRICLNVLVNHAYYQPEGKPDLYDPAGVVFTLKIYNLDEVIKEQAK